MIRLPPTVPLPLRPPDDALVLLADGAIELVGRVIDSSNATYVVEVSGHEHTVWAVYKPQAGERELWDFEPGLHRRERAAYLLSEWLGWGLVPPTIIRTQAPAGVGSLQLYVDAVDADHYFTLFGRAREVQDALRAIAAFDVVTNNADRKSGHVLADHEGRVWAIDHGLCFAASEKLRTVIWDFAGEEVPAGLLAALAPLADRVPDEIAALLEEAEVDALRSRVRRFLDRGSYPYDPTGRRIPWPLV